MSANSADGLLAVVGSFIGLSAITVSIRFYSRMHQHTSLGFDDWFALLGVITYIGAGALAIEFVVLKQYGYNSPPHTPPPARTKTTFQLAIAYDFLLMNTLACAKLSALFLYRRIFVTTGHRFFRATIAVTVAIIIAWYITFDVLSVLQCGTKTSAFWNGNYAKQCSHGNKVWAKGFGLSDLILDLWVLLLPIPQICRLQTTWSKKLSIIGVFLLACVGLGAAIARVIFFFQAKGGAPRVIYIGVLEAGMTITVINLPSIWHCCTSTIPQNILRSIRSFHTLDSVRSRSNRLRSHDGGDVEQLRSEKGAANVNVHDDKSWTTHDPPAAADPAVSMFHNDVEGGSSFQAYAERVPDDQQTTEWIRNSLPPNAIHVQSSVEVRRS